MVVIPDPLKDTQNLFHPLVRHSENLLQVCGFINESYPVEKCSANIEQLFLKACPRPSKGVTILPKKGVSILGMLLCEGTFGFVPSLYDIVMNLTLNKCWSHTPHPYSRRVLIKLKAI